MIRLFRVAAFFIFFFFITTNQVFAESNYILPYPSNMPGSLSYKIHLLYENISRYWYFGDFGQFNYNLKMADKYLVEAKTLFEYKQYLLGYKALQKSDFYFSNVSPYIRKAQKSNKDTTQKKSVLKEAAQKHIETLERMKTDSPAIFNWQPEKASLTILEIEKAIGGAIDIREKSL